MEDDLRQLEEDMHDLQDEVHELRIKVNNPPRRLRNLICRLIKHNRAPSGLCCRCHDFSRSW